MTTFLDLPGEIRNRIYALVYWERDVQISRSHPQKFRREEKNKCIPMWDDGDLSRHRSRCSLLSPTPGHSLSISTALLRTCHQVSEEAVPFLYANMVFVFDSMVTTNKFLSTASPQGIKCIRSLCLAHQGYGEPTLHDMRTWKIRHDQKWMKTCKRITKDMTALERLRVDLTIRDWPTQLNLAASWAKPVLALQTDQLFHVSIRLQHKAFTPERLAAASLALQKAMTACHISRDNRKAQLGWMARGGASQDDKKAPLPKATRVLVIKVDDPKANKKIGQAMPAIKGFLPRPK